MRRAGGPRFGKPRGDRLMFHPSPGEPGRTSGRSAAGSASPCQGEGRGFESRRPLGEATTGYVRGQLGGVAERRGNGLQSRVHGFKSRLHLGNRSSAIGAAGARFLDTEEVTGSIPVSPTRVCAGQRLVTGLWVTSRSLLAAYGGSKLGAQD